MSNDRNNIIYKYNTLQDIQSQLSEIITELGMREVVIDKIKKSIHRSPFTYEKWLTNSGIINAWPEIEEFLKENPEREAILNGEKRFNAESAREIYKEMDFLPNTQWGYAPCLCGKKCDVACYRHLKGELK